MKNGVEKNEKVKRAKLVLAQLHANREKAGVEKRNADRKADPLRTTIKTDKASYARRNATKVAVAAAFGVVVTGVAKAFSNNVAPGVDAIVAPSLFAGSSSVALAVLEAGESVAQLGRKGVMSAYNYFTTKPAVKKPETLMIEWKKDENAMDVDAKEIQNAVENDHKSESASESKSTHSNDSETGSNKPGF